MGHSATVGEQRLDFEVTKDWNGTDQVILKVPRGASARVSLHGGQVTSWRNERGEELLFTSSKAIFKPPKAMRGGIQIFFPQFGNGGSLEQHGFARNRVWCIDDDPPPLHQHDGDDKVSVDLLLKPSEDDMKCWPHYFEFRLRVSLSMDGDLVLVSRIRNINGKPFNFSFGYHTYFSVSDISEVRIEGLETLDYLDNLCERERFTEQGDAITFENEVDRVYLRTPNVIAVLDHEKKRTFVIRKEGLPDVDHVHPPTQEKVSHLPLLLTLPSWKNVKTKFKGILDVLIEQDYIVQKFERPFFLSAPSWRSVKKMIACVIQDACASTSREEYIVPPPPPWSSWEDQRAVIANLLRYKFFFPSRDRHYNYIIHWKSKFKANGSLRGIEVR